MNNAFRTPASQPESERLAFLQGMLTDRSRRWEDCLPRLLDFGCATFGVAGGILFRQPEEGGPEVAVARSGACRQDAQSQPGAINEALSAPVLVGGRAWGRLCFCCRSSREMPVPAAADRQFLAFLADWIGQELEREEKEQRLHELSAWQQAILDGANYAIIATDPEGNILNFNQGAERMLGYRAEEVVGKHSPALIHDAAEVAECAATLSEELGCPVEPGFEVFITRARRGELEEREWTYIGRNGRRIPVLLSISAIKDVGGHIRGFLGIAVDLTLRKQLEARAAAAQAHELSHGVIRAIAEGIFCLGPRPPYPIQFANPFAAGLLNLPEADIFGRSLGEVLSIRAESVHDPIGMLEALKPRDATAFEAEVASPGRPEGFPAAVTLARTDAAMGGILVLTIQDISHRRRTEQGLRLSAKVLEVCSEAVMITDAEGVVININPAFTWLTGYRPDEIIGQTPRLLKSGRHDADFYARMWKSLRDTGAWSGEIWDRRKDGSIYPKWTSINAVTEDGRVTHFVSLFHDISETKAHESRIQYLAEHDSLTGLPNRRILEFRVGRLIASGRRSDQEFAVILIDLDRFKIINDTLGHLVGDQVLIEVARRLANAVRSTDTVVRLGGDEFVILLAGIPDPADLGEVIGKIHRSLGEPIRLEGRLLHAPPSMGVALYPGDGEDVDTLLRHADAAMYQTKARGRNGWTFYTAEMNRRMEERLGLEEGLRQALLQGGLAIHFQPLLDAASGRIASWEALLRWRHPEWGDVSPEKIVLIAEECGLIDVLGNWVIRSACQEMRRWEDAGLGCFRISVNISLLQLDQDGFEEAVLAALEEAGLEPGRLELEITENILMSRSPRAISTLESLRRRGVLVTLDDFGTGYSSLAYLRNLSVDRVKIDSSFIRKITTDHSDASIVQAVVSLARSLDLAVVGEGVETPEQHAFLRRHGCTEVQGFLLGQPMPAEAIAAFLQGMPPGEGQDGAPGFPDTPRPAR